MNYQEVDFQSTHKNLRFQYSNARIEINHQKQYLQIVYSALLQKLSLQKTNVSALKKLFHETQKHKINNPSNCCDHMCNYFIEIFQSQLRQSQTYIQRVENRIVPIIKNHLIKQRDSLNGLEFSINQKDQGIKKTLKQIKQIETRYNEKYIQLNKRQQNFIVLSIQSKGFLEKNKLCIKTNDYYQNQVLPLKHQYNSLVNLLRNSIQQFCALNQQAYKYVIGQLSSFQRQKLNQIIDFNQSFKKAYHENSIADCRQALAKIVQDIPKNLDVCQLNHQSFFSLPSTVDYYYFSTLFEYASKPQLNKLEYLMDFGVQVGSRESCSSLNDSFISSTIPSKLNFDFIHEYPQETIEEIQKYFFEVFCSTEKKSAEAKHLLSLTEHKQQLRKLVLLCFETFRQHQIYEIPEQHFPNIIYYLNYFLDQCLNESDIYNSKYLLSLTFTYYILKSQNEVYLYKYLRTHMIWYDCTQWWTCAFLQSCYEALVATPSSNADQENMVTLWLIKGIGKNSQFSGMNPKMRIFNLLDSFTVRMQTMEIDRNIINELVSKFIGYFELRQIVSEQQSNLQGYLGINNLQVGSTSNQGFFRRLFS